MDLFSVIDKRRSVRKYDKSLLSLDELDKISAYLRGIKQLDCPPAEFSFVGKDAVTYKNAPHYVLAHSNHSIVELINVGYVLSKLDLYLQSRSYGSIFLGIPKPKDDSQREDFTIMLGFGKTSVPMRNGESAFDRLPINMISNSDCLVAKSINLAPSACNSQPWQVEFDSGIITINYVGRGIFKRFIKSKFSKIDLGIALNFAELALQKEGNEITNLEMFSDEAQNNYGIKIFFKSN